FWPWPLVCRAGSWLKSHPFAQFCAKVVRALLQHTGDRAGTGVGLAPARVELCWAVMPAKVADSVLHTSVVLVVELVEVVLLDVLELVLVVLVLVLVVDVLVDDVVDVVVVVGPGVALSRVVRH